MSCLDSICVQGVRSFGPDHAEKITFLAPLTLILGPNGSGKTTIIECLKYMTSGDMPSPKTGAFFHDPKVAGENVSGKIEFAFHDVCGQPCTANRSFTATRNPNDEHRTNYSTQKCKICVNGEESHKKAQRAHEMGSLLGVSKKVLEAVIFCTQEEADWPLSFSDTNLKKEFDAIFEASQYVKALDAIKDVQKNLVARIGGYKKDAEHLKQNVDGLKMIRNTICDEEKLYNDQGHAISGLKQQLEPIEKTLRDISVKREEMSSLQNEIGNLKKEHEIRKKSRLELERNIQNKFTGSSDELMAKLQDFDSHAKRQVEALTLKETEMWDVSNKWTRNSDEKSDLLKKQGELKQEAKRYEEILQMRDGLIWQLAVEYGFEGYSGQLSEQQVMQFSQVMQLREVDLNNSIKAIQVDYQAGEMSIQKETDALNASHTALQTQMQYKRKTLTTNRRESAQIERKIAGVNIISLRDKITAIQTELEAIERKLKEIEDGADLKNLETEIVSLQEQRTTLREKHKSLEVQLNRLRLESTARTELEFHMKDKAARMNDVRARKVKIEKEMKRIVGYMPEENLKVELDKKIKTISKAIDMNNDHIENLDRTKTRHMEQCKIHRNDLNRKEQELQGYKQKLNDLIGNQTFDNGLVNLQANLKQAQDKKGNLSGEHALYDAYAGRLREDDPPCPLCSRRFTDRSQVEELIRELRAKVNAAPASLDQLEHDIDIYQRKVRDLNGLRPMMNLELETIPHLRKSINDLENHLQASEIVLTNKRSTLAAHRNDKEQAHAMLTDVEIIDSTHKDLKELDNVISEKRVQLTGNSSGCLIQDVQREKDEIYHEFERITQHLDQQQLSRNEHLRTLQTLKERKHQLNVGKFALEQELHQISTLEQKKNELGTTNANLEQQVKEIEQKLRPLVDSINTKVREKQTLSQERDQKLTDHMAMLNSMKKTHQEVLTCNTEIRSYLEQEKDKKLEMNITLVNKAEALAAELSTISNNLAAEIEKIKEDQRLQEGCKRDLEATLQVRETEDQISKLTIQIESVESRLRDIRIDENEVANLDFHRRHLRHSQEETKRQQLVSEGRLSQLREQLNQAMFQNVEVSYRDKMIELKTSELAQQDMEKYHKVLKIAILKYHSSKMKEVNKIIHELWRHTYRGNDIESIEIQLEEEFTSGTKAYNYRVVMLLGGIPIDMRQRCSAGQKVLASLIIRLALAETFCLNCGVLALDEPTTNLDRANIESLAEALSEIIKHRSQQKNFQLIIITHDEDFVEMLGRACSVQDYYKVYKNREGCSKIARARVQALHMR